MNIHRAAQKSAHHRPALAVAVAFTLATAILIPGSAPSAAGSTAVPPACTSIRAELGRVGAAAGSTYQTIRLRNTGATTCRIGGYPLLEYVNRHHHMLGWPAGRDRMKHHPHTLAAGQAARTVLVIPDPGDFPRIDCVAHNAHQIRVRVGSAASSYLGWDQQECTTRFGRSMVSPVRR